MANSNITRTDISRIIAKLDAINAYIDDLPKKVEEVANTACEEAKNILDSFSADIELLPQQHRVTLSDYLEVVQNSANANYFEIVAGDLAPKKIKQELYFTEYGAGLMYEPPNIAEYIYVPVSKESLAGKSFWYWQDLDGKYYRCEGVIALHFMRRARDVARQGLKGISGGIKTVIRR